MKDLTIILPLIHFEDESKKKMLEECIKSIGKEKTIVIGPQEAIDMLDQVVPEYTNKKNVTVVLNDGDTSYPSQVNMAVDSVKTKYFSVIEYDDFYTKKWFDNVAKYLENEIVDTMAYLPLTEVLDAKSNRVVGYANEAFWASSFSDEIGCMDMNSILDYLNFNTSGGIFNTEDFISMGKLKTSMKMVFWYEFLLRAIYKGKRFFIIPKVGYVKRVNVDGSLSMQYGETMSEKEVDWWIDTARTEYFFKQDRNKKYEE